MTTEPHVSPQPRSSLVRRIIGGALIAIVLFVALSYLLTSAYLAGAIAAGAGTTLVAGSSVSDLLETILEAIVSAVSVVLAAIGAIFAAIFNF